MDEGDVVFLRKLLDGAGELFPDLTQQSGRRNLVSPMLRTCKEITPRINSLRFILL
jgi:hypothetical protein